MRVEIQPKSVTVEVGREVGLSTLAYDSDGQPIWSGVTYDWGISSQRSIATLRVNHDIATLIPLGPGSGQLFVTARLDNANVTSSIPIIVTGASPSDTPLPSPSYTIEDLKTALGLYGGTLDEAYWVDGKINMIDTGHVIRYLAK